MLCNGIMNLLADGWGVLPGAGDRWPVLLPLRAESVESGLVVGRASHVCNSVKILKPAEKPFTALIGISVTDRSDLNTRDKQNLPCSALNFLIGLENY